MNSIKIKIIVWCLAIFSILFAGLEFVLYYELEDLAVGFIDDHVKSEINFLDNLLKIEATHGQLEVEFQELETSARGEYAVKLSGHYYQIVSEKGKILSRSPSLGLASTSLTVPTPDGTDFIYVTMTGPNGEPLRVAARADTVAGRRLIFVAGESLEDTYKLLKSFRKIVLVVYPAAFFLCAMGIYFLTGWALVPLRYFSEKVSQITDRNLYERVSVEKNPAELKPLAVNFNTMLERLEGSFERRKQFLSDASHELRTPTSIIKSYCDVLLGRERSPRAYREGLEKIGATVNRMSNIINRILVLSRLDSKTTLINPVRIDLKDAVGDVLRLMRPAAARKKVRMHLNGENINIRADSEGLTEVFTNVIENAVKYNRENGTVDITIGRENGYARVTVSDTGIGIPEEDLDRIFQRFYRSDSSRALTRGTGLGLSIVKSIVEANGGRVTVKSTLGQGSTFNIWLPIEGKA